MAAVPGGREVEVHLLLVVRVPPERHEERVHDPMTNLLFRDVLNVAEHFRGDLRKVTEPTTEIDCFHRGNRWRGTGLKLTSSGKPSPTQASGLLGEERLDGPQRSVEPLVRRKSEHVRKKPFDLVGVDQGRTQRLEQPREP